MAPDRDQRSRDRMPGSDRESGAPAEPRDTPPALPRPPHMRPPNPPERLPAPPYGDARATHEPGELDDRPTPLAEQLRRAAGELPRSGPGPVSELAVTSRIERVHLDPPAPLPPSPAAADAAAWFEQVPTNPAAVPDLNDLAGSASATAPTRAGFARRVSPGDLAGDEPWTRTDYSQPQPGRASTATTPAPQHPWLLPILIAATALAVGMVLGALLFSDSQPAAADSECECAPSGPVPAENPAPGHDPRRGTGSVEQ